MQRRRFLQLSALAAPVSRAATPTGIKLGFDSYSIRAFRWNAPQLLDYAAKLQLDSVQLSSLGDFESLEAPYLAKVRDQAARLGLTIDGGIGCICPTAQGWKPAYGKPEEYVRLGLRVAKSVGATSMRCYLGDSRDRLGKTPIERHVETTVKILRSVRTYAQDMGVKIALENHSGDLQARELRALIEEAGKDYVAACLDTGNPMWVVEDPQVTLEVLGPYTVTTHIRDSIVYEHPHGAAAQWVALGDGVVDFKAFVALYQKLCPQSVMQLEVITGRPPRVLPYLEADFWKAFPRADASEFARFVALAKKGRPFSGAMIIADVEGGQFPPEYKAALQAQQRYDLEKSLEHAKKVLGVGVRWRMA